ncbi:hypothetical protein [Maricaulis maris]|uniref:hypothetical protein n=1 Tax=Maricaulis maris TaxID=74318 RepID=UPI003A8F8A27
MREPTTDSGHLMLNAPQLEFEFCDQIEGQHGSDVGCPDVGGEVISFQPFLDRQAHLLVKKHRCDTLKILEQIGLI